MTSYYDWFVRSNIYRLMDFVLLNNQFSEIFDTLGWKKKFLAVLGLLLHFTVIWREKYLNVNKYGHEYCISFLLHI